MFNINSKKLVYLSKLKGFKTIGLKRIFSTAKNQNGREKPQPCK